MASPVILANHNPLRAATAGGRRSVQGRKPARKAVKRYHSGRTWPKPPAARETFRHHTYVSLAATGLVSGFGLASYELAVEAAARLSA